MTAEALLLGAAVWVRAKKSYDSHAEALEAVGLRE
jgi:hypothetical protein